MFEDNTSKPQELEIVSALGCSRVHVQHQNRLSSSTGQVTSRTVFYTVKQTSGEKITAVSHCMTVNQGAAERGHTLFPDSAAAVQSWTLCTAFLGHKVQFAFFLHGIKLINPHWRWLTYVRKKEKGGFLLECSYREME